MRRIRNEDWQLRQLFYSVLVGGIYIDGGSELGPPIMQRLKLSKLAYRYKAYLDKTKWGDEEDKGGLRGSPF